MLSQDKHEKIYAKRRRHKDWYFGFPLYKRAILALERLNKALWTGLLGKVLGVRSVPAPLNPNSIRSILFIRNDAIGDMVLTTPLWRSIRRQFPHIRIGVAASFRNRAIIEHDPNVDRIFDATDGDFKAMLRAKKEIAKETWDVVMPMIYYRKTRMAIITRLLAPKSISSMLVKAGENVEHRKKLFSIIVQSPYRTDEIEMIEQMRIHAMGVIDMQIPDEEWSPILYPDPHASAKVEAKIKHILVADQTSEYIHINLEAKNAFREYGMEGSLNLSRRLREEFPMASILWTSSPQSASRAVAFLESHPVPGVHYFNTDSIHELLALVKGASLVISPDTAAIHIASAFKRPVVALYPVRQEWPPYKTPFRLLLTERDQPVSSIPLESILEACWELLSTRNEVPAI